MEAAVTSTTTEGAVSGPRRQFSEDVGLAQALVEAIRQHPDDPQVPQALTRIRELIHNLRPQADSIREAPRTAPPELLQDYQMLRSFYRSASTFLEAHRSRSGTRAFREETEQLEHFQTAVTSTEGSMRLLRDQLRLTYRDVTHTSTPVTREQFANARMVATISRDLGEPETLHQDLQRWQFLISAQPPSQQGRASTTRVQQLMELAVFSEQAGDHTVAEEALGVANRNAMHLQGSERTLAATQLILWSTGVPGTRSERIRNFWEGRLDNELTNESVSPSVRQARAVDQAMAILTLRSQGHTIDPSPTLLTTLRASGSILARFAATLDPQSTQAPADILDSLSTAVPRTLTEDLVVRLGQEVNHQRAELNSGNLGTTGTTDPLTRALQNFDDSRHQSIGQVDSLTSQLEQLTASTSTLTVRDAPRIRELLAQAQTARDEVEHHLSNDSSLRTFQMQSLLHADRAILGLRRQLGGLWGGACTEWFGESEANFASGNTQIEHRIESTNQDLREERQRAVTVAHDEHATVENRLYNYRLANRIDVALDSGNDRVQDLVAWQALLGTVTDSDLPAAERFSDLGDIMAGFHAMRQRHYDERSVDIRDTSWHWTGTQDYETAGILAAASPNRIQMSEADLTQHMTQVESSMVALLPTLNPTSDGSVSPANALYQAQLDRLVQAQPGAAASTVANDVLPLLSADGFLRFEQEPATQQVLLDQLTAQADRHLSEGHMTADTIRDPAQTVRLSNGQPHPLSDYISGATDGHLTFTSEYQSLSVDDRRQVIQGTLHLGRLGEYRAALQAETDPVRQHFRTAMVALEEGNTVQAEAEFQTFLRDSRAPGEGPRLQPAADPQLQAMRTVALDMNRRFMTQALDRMSQVAQEVDTQRASRLLTTLDQSFGRNEATISALRTLINDPNYGFYTIEEALPIVRHDRIVAEQARFESTMGGNTLIVPPGGPDVVDLTNVGNLPLYGPDSVSAHQERQQARESQAYQGMSVVGSVETRFGGSGLIPEGSSLATFTNFQEHPEQALDGVPTVQVPPHGTVTFVPHRGADRGSTSMLRVEIPPEGGTVLMDRHEGGGRLQRMTFPPSAGPRFVLLYDDHGREAAHRGSGMLGAHSRDIPIIGDHSSELDPMLQHVLDFESYASVQRRGQSPDANRRASLALAQQLRQSGGSYTAAGRILEEVMASDIHSVQQSIPQSELRRVTQEAEADRPHMREEVTQRVFEMMGRGMPRPSQSQIDAMVEQAVQQRVETQVRQLVFTRMRERHDRNDLDPVSREAWETFNDMMDPLGEWLNFSDASEDRIADEVCVNLAFTIASGGLGSAAGGAARLAVTRMAGRWLASEGTTLIGERAALWAATSGARSYAGRAALWFMGEAATESGSRIAARGLVWGAGVVAEGTVFHASMTGMQSTWGYIRNGEWVFPEPGEFAVGAGESILMMGSISVGNAAWGRVAEEIGVTPQQVARMTDASLAARGARLAVHHAGQLATEGTLVTLTGSSQEGQSFGTRLVENFGTILELRAGGHLFNAVTGDALPRMQARLEDRILQTRLRNIVQTRMGVDPTSADGAMLLEAMNFSIAQGHSPGHVEQAVTPEHLEALRNTVRQELDIDPNTEAGRELTALLLVDVTGRATRRSGVPQLIQDLPGRIGELESGLSHILEQSGSTGEPREQLRQRLLRSALAHGMTAEQVQGVNAGVTIVLEQGGFHNAEESNTLRLALLEYAISSGQSPEHLQDIANHAEGLGDRIHDMTNSLYGPNTTSTAFGRNAESQILLWALSRSEHPADLPRILEGLSDAIPELRQSLESTTQALGFTPRTPAAALIFSALLTWALSQSDNAEELSTRMQTASRESGALRSDLTRFTQQLGYRADSPEGQRIALALLMQVRAEPGGTSAFNRTRLSSYVTSAQDFGRQVDFMIAAGGHDALRANRSRLVVFAIQTAQTPEDLHQMAQRLQEGSATLEIGANGEMIYAESVTTASPQTVESGPAPAPPGGATPPTADTLPLAAAQSDAVRRSTVPAEGTEEVSGVRPIPQAPAPLIREAILRGEAPSAPSEDAQAVAPAPAHGNTVGGAPSPLAPTFQTTPNGPVYTVRAERVPSPDSTRPGSLGVVFTSIADLAPRLNGDIPAEVRGMILAATRLNRQRGVATVNPEFTLMPGGRRLIMEFGPPEARQRFSLSTSQDVSMPPILPQVARPQAAPVGTAAIPEAYSSEGRSYRVETQALEGTPSLAAGEIAFTDPDHPPRHLSRVQQEVLEDTSAFAKAQGITQGRFVIATERSEMAEGNNIFLEFERDGTRHRLTLQHTAVETTLEPTAPGAFRVEDGTLHVDFTPQNLMTRRVEVGGQIFSIHIGAGNSFTLRNEHPTEGSQVTIVHANPDQLDPRQVEYPFRILPESEVQPGYQVRGAVQVSRVEPALDTAGQPTGELRVSFQRPDGQSHTQIVLRQEAEQNFHIPLTADGHLDTSRPAPRLVQAEGDPARGELRSIGEESRPQQETLGFMEGTSIAPGDRITINGETVVFQPELAQATETPPQTAAERPTVPPPQRRAAASGRSDPQAPQSAASQGPPTARPPRRGTRGGEELQAPQADAPQAPPTARPPRRATRGGDTLDSAALRPPPVPADLAAMVDENPGEGAVEGASEGHVVPLRPRTDRPGPEPTALAADSSGQPPIPDRVVIARGPSGANFQVLPAAGAPETGTVDARILSAAPVVGSDQEPTGEIRVRLAPTDGSAERTLTMPRQDAERHLGLQLTTEGHLDSTTPGPTVRLVEDTVVRPTTTTRPPPSGPSLGAAGGLLVAVGMGLSVLFDPGVAHAAVQTASDAGSSGHGLLGALAAGLGVALGTIWARGRTASPEQQVSLVPPRAAGAMGHLHMAPGTGIQGPISISEGGSQGSIQRVDGRYSLSASQGVYVADPASPGYRAIRPGESISLQEGTPIGINGQWYVFHPPAEAAFVVRPPQLRPETPEPSILAPRPGETRIGYGRIFGHTQDPQVPRTPFTLERRGTDWVMLSHSTNPILINGRPAGETQVMRDGDVIQVGTERVRFQSQLRVLDYGGGVSITNRGSGLQGGIIGSIYTAVEAHPSGTGRVEVSFSRLDMRSEPLRQVVSVVRMSPEQARRAGIRLTREGGLEPGQEGVSFQIHEPDESAPAPQRGAPQGSVPDPTRARPVPPPVPPQAARPVAAPQPQAQPETASPSRYPSAIGSDGQTYFFGVGTLGADAGARQRIAQTMTFRQGDIARLFSASQASIVERRGEGPSQVLVISVRGRLVGRSGSPEQTLRLEMRRDAAERAGILNPDGNLQTNRMELYQAPSLHTGTSGAERVSWETSGLPTRRTAGGRVELDIDALAATPAGSADTQWHVRVENRGGAAAGSSDGIGYNPQNPHNEDRYLVVPLPDGRTITVAIDGMGGHEGGERAASIAAQVIQRAVQAGRSIPQALDLADRAVVQDSLARQGLDPAAGASGLAHGSAGAVITAVESRPNADGSFSITMHTIGDTSAAVVDLNAQPGSDIVAQSWGEGVDQVGRMPDQALGGSYLGPYQQVAPELAQATARRGQVLFTGSDGFWENWRGGPGEIAEFARRVGPPRSAERIHTALMEETLVRMRLLQSQRNSPDLTQDRPGVLTPRPALVLTREAYAQAYREVTGHAPPDGPWRYEGMVLLDDGSVREPAPAGSDPGQTGRIVGNFKADNVTLVVQVLGETVEATPRGEAAVRPQAAAAPVQAAPQPPVAQPSPVISEPIALNFARGPMTLENAAILSQGSGYSADIRLQNPQAEVWIQDGRRGEWRRLQPGERTHLRRGDGLAIGGDPRTSQAQDVWRFNFNDETQGRSLVPEAQGRRPAPAAAPQPEAAVSVPAMGGDVTYDIRPLAPGPRPQGVPVGRAIQAHRVVRGTTADRDLMEVVFQTGPRETDRISVRLSRASATTVGLRFSPDHQLDTNASAPEIVLQVRGGSVSAPIAADRPPVAPSARAIVVGDHPYSVQERRSTDGSAFVYTLTNEDLSAGAEQRRPLQIRSPQQLGDAQLEGIAQGRWPAGVTAETRRALSGSIPVTGTTEVYLAPRAGWSGFARTTSNSVELVDGNFSGDPGAPAFILQVHGGFTQLMTQADGITVIMANGSPVPASPSNPRAYDLGPGDRVRIGGIEMTFDGRRLTLPTGSQGTYRATAESVRVPAPDLGTPMMRDVHISYRGREADFRPPAPGESVHFGRLSSHEVFPENETYISRQHFSLQAAEQDGVLGYILTVRGRMGLTYRDTNPNRGTIPQDSTYPQGATIFLPGGRSHEFVFPNGTGDSMRIDLPIPPLPTRR